MRRYDLRPRAEGRSLLAVPYRGADLLGQAMYNKSSAFDAEERAVFGLDGLLPEVISTMDQQARRVYGNIVRKSDPLEQYIGLMALQDRNEHLFYRVLLDHLQEFLPVVYTPTVGQASKEFSHIFRRGRGIWITPAHRGRMAEVLRNSPFAEVRLLVVTDNQAILGIGDQGAGGMVIPIGKLSIYSAAAGIHPAQTLPVSLDVGTDNEELLADNLYLGWRQPRLRGEAYFGLIDEFVSAVGEVFPRALIQWEDFQKSNAFELLELYRSRTVSFNDDIQGTGATALAGLLAACRVSGESLSEQRVVIVGGGAAGIGIATQLRSALGEAGLKGEALIGALAVLDSRGLLVDDREGLDAYKRPLAWPAALAASRGLGEERSLAAVVHALRPTVVIGSSGQAGLFSQELVREMALHVERPVIFPFSNPTALAEALPRDLFEWTDGRALVASGSPFEPVTFGDREIHVGQGNNAFVFPGIGLGALVAEAREISDTAFSAAARALADSVTADELERGLLYPSVGRLREVTVNVASAVVEQVGAEGLGLAVPPDEVRRRVEAAMWQPEYPQLVPV